MILNDVKQTLRITHNMLDNDLMDKIAAAKRELITNGISKDLVENPSDPLILEAIKTYCQYKYTRDDKEMQNYYNSWVVQVDKLRKTQEYRSAADV